MHAIFLVLLLFFALLWMCSFPFFFPASLSLSHVSLVFFKEKNSFLLRTMHALFWSATEMLQFNVGFVCGRETAVLRLRVLCS
jgi:hypothetical protein